MTSPDHRSRFSRSLLLAIIIFIVLSVFFGIYVRAEKQIDRNNKLRQRSFLLADELRQSSDDLTRMVRSYVITGNPIYKQHFQEILDIRDGKKPRPVDYQDIYWDLVLDDDRRPRPDGQPIALLELMRQAGYTEQEFAKLAQAKTNSDALTATEFVAMSLMESTDPPSDVNRFKASLMLQDAAYHQAKAGIMQPISEFFQMMDQRTQNEVHAAEIAALRFRMAFMALGVLLALSIWRA